MRSHQLLGQKIGVDHLHHLTDREEVHLAAQSFISQDLKPKVPLGKEKSFQEMSQGLLKQSL